LRPGTAAAMDRRAEAEASAPALLGVAVDEPKSVVPGLDGRALSVDEETILVEGEEDSRRTMLVERAELEEENLLDDEGSFSHHHCFLYC
jgi:hypothetical protein